MFARFAQCLLPRPRSFLPPIGSSRSCLRRLRGCSIAIMSIRMAQGQFRLACEHDLGGIVAKRKNYPYLPERETSWLKIRNDAWAIKVRRCAVYKFALLFPVKRRTTNVSTTAPITAIMMLPIRPLVAGTSHA